MWFKAMAPTTRLCLGFRLRSSPVLTLIIIASILSHIGFSARYSVHIWLLSCHSAVIVPFLNQPRFLNTVYSFQFITF